MKLKRLIKFCILNKNNAINHIILNGVIKNNSTSVTLMYEVESTVIVAGFEPASLGSEIQRLIHWATRPMS